MKRSASQRGYALVEVLLWALLAVMLMMPAVAALARLVPYSNDCVASTVVDQELRFVLNSIVKDFHAARAYEICQDGQEIIITLNGDSANKLRRVSYTVNYNFGNGRIVKDYQPVTGQSGCYPTDIQKLQFSRISDRSVRIIIQADVCKRKKTVSHCLVITSDQIFCNEI